MFCVIAKDTQILGVMLKRNIEEEARWKKEDLRGLESPEGMVLYSVEDLDGFESFTKFYGFELMRDSNNKVVGIADAEGHLVNKQDVQFLDISNYPELENVLKKY